MREWTEKRYVYIIGNANVIVEIYINDKQQITGIKPWTETFFKNRSFEEVIDPEERIHLDEIFSTDAVEKGLSIDYAGFVAENAFIFTIKDITKNITDGGVELFKILKLLYSEDPVQKKIGEAILENSPLFV